MQKKLLPILLMVLFFGCDSPSKFDIFSTYNAVGTQLNNKPNIRLFVITDDRKGHFWFWYDKNRKTIKTVQYIPQTMQRVCQLLSSPDDRYLAVMSSGEGIYIVDIFNVNEILHEREEDSNGTKYDPTYTEDIRLFPIYCVSSYPGYVSIVKWKNNNSITLESDVPLNLLDKKERAVPMKYVDQEGDHVIKTYEWNMKTDNIIGQ